MSDLKKVSETDRIRDFLNVLGYNPEDFDPASMTDVDTMKAHLRMTALLQGRGLIVGFPDETRDGSMDILDTPWLKR